MYPHGEGFLTNTREQPQNDMPPPAASSQGDGVLVVGSINTDLVVTVPLLPQAGETVLGDDLRRIGGGKGANQAVAAARLGAGTALLGCVGADEFGNTRISELESYGIEVGAILTDSQRPSGAALILVDTGGDNVIAVSPGANGALVPAHVQAAQTLFAQANVLICQLEISLETVAAALTQARRNNVTSILNAAPGNPAAASLLTSTDILIVNRAEAASLVGHLVDSLAAARETAAQLSGQVRRAAIVTLGDEGSIIACDGSVKHLRAWQVPTVDGTAAGDAYVGAVAAALARGDSLLVAARLGTAAAAITVGRIGAQPSLPTQQEVTAFLHNPPAVASRAGEHT